MRLLTIPPEWQKNTDIPKEKLFDSKDECLNEVISVYWHGCIKPKIAQVEPTITERLRYEEIHLFEVKIQSRRLLYDIAREISKKIKYPCVIEYHIDEVTVIGICRFTAGKKDFTENVNVQILFSHFLRAEYLSRKAQHQVDKINEILKSNGEIGELYLKIYSEISAYPLGGTSMSHVDRLITDMIGKIPLREKCDFRKYCEPYEYHAELYTKSRYNNIKSKKYTLIHDYEEIWFCFMQNDRTRKAIERRRYKDIEDLIFSIENRYW